MPYKYSDDDVARHVAPWLVMTSSAEMLEQVRLGVPGPDVNELEAQVRDSVKACVNHYGQDQFERMSYGMLEAVASASNDVEKQLNLAALLPPLETCPTCTSMIEWDEARAGYHEQARRALAARKAQSE